MTMNSETLSRRDFIQRSGLVGAGVTAAQMIPLRFLQAAADAPLNPLAGAPNRGTRAIGLWRRIGSVPR